MKILLIQPKMNMRPMDTHLKTRMAPSLALLTLAALTPKEHEIILLNENIERLDFNTDADLVAITVTVDVMDKAKEIARRFSLRGIPSIAGGIHITAMPYDALPHFDAICVGLAERVWHKVLSDAKAGSLRKIYHDDEAIMGKEILPPDFSALSEKNYLITNVMCASRGCSFKCDFCYNNCKHALPRQINRPVPELVEKIKRSGLKQIFFIDDNFIGNPAWTHEFLDAIKPLNIIWNAAVDASISNHPDILDKMQQTNCRSLFIGFESINQSSLVSVHKKQNNVQHFERLIHNLHARNIMINASIVFGLPGDHPDVFSNTAEWLTAHKVETATAHILTPYPGTKLYRQLKSENKITDFDLSHYDTAHVVFRPENMTAAELYQGYINFYKQFYSFKNIVKRIPKSSDRRIPYLLFSLFYRKFGRLTDALSNIIPLRATGKLLTKLSYKL